MPDEIELPPPFVPYAIAGIGTVVAHTGDTYEVRAPNGSVYGYRAHSGTPSTENAAADIAFAIANPPAFPQPVPPSVTRRQLLLVLNAAGVTRAMIRAQIGDNEAALIEYEEATSFDRAHPLVAHLAAAMGLGTEQVDDLFRSAAQL